MLKRSWVSRWFSPVDPSLTLPTACCSNRLLSLPELSHTKVNKIDESITCLATGVWHSLLAHHLVTNSGRTTECISNLARKENFESHVQCVPVSCVCSSYMYVAEICAKLCSESVWKWTQITWWFAKAGQGWKITDYLYQESCGSPWENGSTQLLPLRNLSGDRGTPPAGSQQRPLPVRSNEERLRYQSFIQ
jgi:hypothetical protein